MPEYTLTELMAVTAAREIGDGEIVFAGTGLPMLGAMLAQHTHAPNCCIIFEAGAMASQLEHLPMSVGDPRTLRGAATAAGLSEIDFVEGYVDQPKPAMRQAVCAIRD